MMRCATCGKENNDGATACVACGSVLVPAGPVQVGAAVPPSGAAVSFSPSLQAGTKLQNGAFTVGKVLGQGGFGITYKGGDMKLRRYVAIKEFFPNGAHRAGQTVQPAGGMTAADYQKVKTKFLEEARTLARFNDPGIVRVFATFEENNTAYMVMEFLEGDTLQQLLDTKGTLHDATAVDYIEKVGASLKTVHATNMIHRDIKPDNILITGDGRVVLIDFGTARAFAAGKTIKQTAMLTPGYAPLEQYGQSARFGAYSDVYALGATLYHCLTGQMPPPATDRATGVDLQPPDVVNPYIKREVSNAVVWSLQIKADQRPQNIQAFLDALKSGRGQNGAVHGGHTAVALSSAQNNGLAVPANAVEPYGTNGSPTLPPNTWVQRIADNQLSTNAPPMDVLTALQRAFQTAGAVSIRVDQPAYRVLAMTRDTPQNWGQQITGQVMQAPTGIMVVVTGSLSGQGAGVAHGNPETAKITSALESMLGGSPHGGSPLGSNPPALGWQGPPPVQNQFGPPVPIPAPHGLPQNAPVHPRGYPQGHNANNSVQLSGLGPSSSPLPTELQGPNWGACLLGFFWGFAHGTPLLSLACLLVFPIFPASILILPIVAAVKGNEWAWQNRKWQSIQQFKDTQLVWQNAGLASLAVSLLLGTLLFVLGSN